MISRWSRPHSRGHSRAFLPIMMFEAVDCFFHRDGASQQVQVASLHRCSLSTTFLSASHIASL